MNEQVTKILQLGIIFTVVIVFLDVFLTQLPVLDWLALGITFFFIAVAILDSLARLVPKEKRGQIQVLRKEEDEELEQLANLVARAINRRENEAQKLLSEKLRSIALGTAAARTGFSKREIRELAEKDPDSLRMLVKDEQIMKLLAGNGQFLSGADASQLDELISKIESWSR